MQRETTILINPVFDPVRDFGIICAGRDERACMQRIALLTPEKLRNIKNFAIIQCNTALIV